jgi:hypothetical protein
MKEKIPYLLLSIISFLFCVFIVLFFSDSPFIRGFLGDAVIVILLFNSIKIFFNFENLKLSVVLILFSYCIEFTQYIKIIPLFGFKENLLTRIIFGSVYDPLDLLAYTFGGISAYFIDRFFISSRRLQ